MTRTRRRRRWCKVCYLWIRVVCVARMGPGVQRTKKNTPSGTFVLHRISNPENLLGRQKCYPYTNGVFFARSTDGCAAMRTVIGQLCSISTVRQRKPHGILPARSRELTKLFRSCITFTSTGTTVSSLRIATYALCAAAQFQKLKEHWQFQEQHATTNNSSPRNNRRSPGAATTVAAAL